MVPIFLAAALNLVVLARAPPGVPVNPDVAQFYHSLKTPEGYSCCGDPDPDCRMPVAVRLTRDHYSALIAREDFVDNIYDRAEWERQFGDAALTWIDIPDDRVVVRPDNPIKAAIVCFSVRIKRVFCFVPWDTGG
jgi:hypothetical protein